MLTKGHGIFSLERLLTIFQCITSVLEEDFTLNEGNPPENGFGLMSDVLLQVSTLCAIQTSSVRVEIVPWRDQ
jgi:hypothetical protein